MDNTRLLQGIRRIYSEYLSETERLTANSKRTDGLLGFGRGPGTDDCHDRFSARVEQAFEAILAAAPSSQDVEEVLRFVYAAPLTNRQNELACWMLVAVHSLTEKLIDLLTPEDAATLSALYMESYSRSNRLPAQKKILEKLLTQAGEKAPQKKNFLLDIFRRTHTGRGGSH